MATDFPVTELWRVITGEAEGRTSREQITLFDSVGFATEDLSALRYVRDAAQRTGFFEDIDLIAAPVDPRNLYGLIREAQKHCRTDPAVRAGGRAVGLTASTNPR